MSGEAMLEDKPADQSAGRANEILSDLEHELWILSRRLRRNVVERARAIDPSINQLGYGCWITSGRDRFLRAADIGCALGVDKGALSRAVHQLVDLDLVERNADPDDAPRQLLDLSDLGRERMQELNQVRRERYLRRMADWGSEEVAVLVTMLARYNASLDRAYDDAHHD